MSSAKNCLNCGNVSCNLALASSIRKVENSDGGLLPRQ